MSFLFRKIVFLAFMILIQVSSRAQDWDTEFSAVDKEYIQGEYKKALKKSEDLTTLVEKRLGKDHVFAARAYFQMARIYDGLGKFEDYKAKSALAVKILETSKKDDPESYAKALAEGTQAGIQYGDYKNAQAHIFKAKDLIQTAKLKDSLLINDLKFKLAEVYFLQGYTLKARDMMDEIIKFRKKRLVRRAYIKDPKSGKVAYKKLSKREFTARKRAYAEAVNFKAEILIRNGHYDIADSILDVANYYILKNIRKKDITYAQNLYLDGVRYEILNKNDKARDAYEGSLKYAKKAKRITQRPTGREVVKKYEKLALMYVQTEKNAKARHLGNALNRKTKKYYGDGNIYSGHAEVMEAERHIFNDQMELAQQQLERILKSTLFPAGHRDRLRPLQLLHSVYMKFDMYDKAEPLLREITQINKGLMGEAAPAYHLSLLDLANFKTLYSNDFKEAEQIYDHSLNDIVSKEVDHRQRNFINYLYTQGKLYELTDRYEDSYKVLSVALAEIKAKFGKEHFNYAIALEKLANVEIVLGKYKEAEKLLNLSSDVFKYLGSTTYDYHVDYAHTLETLARLYVIQGDFDEAEKVLRKAYRLTRKAEDASSEDLKMSSAIEELAQLYIHIGKYQQTEKSLLEALRLKEEKYGSGSRNLINIIIQLGNLYLISGDYTKAETYAKEALESSKHIFGENSIKYSESLDLMQKIYAAVADYESAEEAAEQVVTIQISQYGKKHIQVANSLDKLALIKYYNHGVKPEIEDLFIQALGIIKTNLGENNPQYAEVQKNLALYYAESEKLALAESLLKKADQVWEEKFGSSNIHSAEIDFLRGNISYKKAKYQEAKDYFQKSAGAYRSIFDSNHPDYVKSLSMVGRMNYILGDYKSAARVFDEINPTYLNFIKKYFPSLSERQKNKFWSVIKNDFEFYGTLILKLKDEDPQLISNFYNFSLNTKALLLNTSLKVKHAILSSNDKELIQKYEDWVGKKEFLTTVFSMSVEQKKTNMIDVALLEKEIEKLERDLSEGSEVFGRSLEKEANYNWELVQDNLDENETAVEIVRFRYFDKSFTDSVIYVAMSVTPKTKSHPELAVIGNGKDLEQKYIKYYRNCIKFKLEDVYSYEKFWKPIKKNIKDNSTIYLSGDGVYNQLNLETIFTPSNNYVLDQNEVILVSNTKDIITGNKSQGKQGKSVVSEKSLSKNNGNAVNMVTLFGNPTYYTKSATASISKTVIIEDEGLKRFKAVSGGKIAQLPGAEKEVKSLNSLLNSSSKWKSTIYVEDSASESKIKNLKNPKVFHIATHGFFMEDVVMDHASGINQNKAIQNPLLRAGLLLQNGGTLLETNNIYAFNKEDGILTAYEAMNLSFDKTDLVVLSACETGLGEVQLGEGVYGLQRAFLVAGAKSIIMSLFKVSDEVTSELMTAFYKKWIETGDKRKAFIAAKREVRVKHKDPIFWGAFVMIGVE